MWPPLGIGLLGNLNMTGVGVLPGTHGGHATVGGCPTGSRPGFGFGDWSSGHIPDGIQ